MSEIDVLKKKLERACEVHRLEATPGPRGYICALGLLIPSHLWSNDAEDMISADNQDYDDMCQVMQTWFKGLSRREKLVVLFRSNGMGFKTLQNVLAENFRIGGTSRATLSLDYQKGLLKVLCNAKDNGFEVVFRDI